MVVFWADVMSDTTGAPIVRPCPEPGCIAFAHSSDLPHVKMTASRDPHIPFFANARRGWAQWAEEGSAHHDEQLEAGFVDTGVIRHGAGVSWVFMWKPER